MLLVVTVYNTARDECDMSTEQDGWHANWKRDEVTDSVTFLLHFLITHLCQSLYGPEVRAPPLNESNHKATGGDSLTANLKSYRLYLN